MCELFGLSCSSEERATRSLAVFGGHSEDNPDGWGIGYYKGTRARIHKQPERADLSEGFWKAVERARSRIIIAHLRKKSSGEVCQKNCHPFRLHRLQRDWLFAHNGTLIIDYEPSPELESPIDSARAFTFLMDKVEEYIRERRMRGLYPAVRRATQELLEKYEGTLNYLLSDGHVLYAFCNHRQMYLLRREKKDKKALLVSTQKLESEEPWLELPKHRVLVVSGGDPGAGRSVAGDLSLQTAINLAVVLFSCSGL